MTILKYDVETFWEDIETIIKNNIGAKITSINLEKNDTITLATPAILAFFHDMDDEAANYDPLVLTGLVSNQSIGIGPETCETAVINAAIIINDNGQDLFITKRMLRYQRCLKEIIEANFYSQRSYGKLKIESLPILEFTKKDTSERYKMASINIISSFA